MAIAKPYDDLIMDHIKNARGYRTLADPTHSARGANPLCGDEFNVYVKIAGDRVEDVTFQCSCCGISMASASMMVESVVGKELAEARAQLQSLLASLAAPANRALDEADFVQRALLRTVQEFPARTRCAALPWVTLEAALDDRKEAILGR